MEETIKSLSDLAQLGAGLGIGVAALGVGIGIGIGLKGLMDAISRQPEVAGQAFIYFLIGAALAEACALYALIISLKLLGVW